MLYDFRDNSQQWYLRDSYIEDMENIPGVLVPFRGVLWDVGANVGLYSCMWRKYGGDRAIAFELSPKAASYISRNIARNKLSSIEVVARGLSVRPVKYKVPTDSSAGNRITQPEENSESGTTMTYHEALEKYGVPNVIKLDVEGYENEFLSDPQFISLVRNNDIRLIVEIHDPKYIAQFPELKFTCLNERNFRIQV
jgi:FkbM family methyltransferase